MDPYLFHGVVLPERAQLNLHFSVRCMHLHSGVEVRATVSIVLNQVVVWVETDKEWDIFDLRNAVSSLVQHHLSMLAFLLGHAYEFSITRVLNRSRNVDWVFGIDTPLVLDEHPVDDVGAELLLLRNKTTGPNGVYLNRCFGDLTAALKFPDDTPFYCYRALESLRHHAAAVHGLRASSSADQWAKFREVANCEKAAIMTIKDAADGLRHGDPLQFENVDRAEVIRATWRIVRAYVGRI
ncbi:hypothetical protein [Burkholderia anthina]|uniref:hypothetical protein n=1 Tax=Burkholderia anthina TaxID=179879 RepID=UPI0037C0D39B